MVLSHCAEPLGTGHFDSEIIEDVGCTSLSEYYVTKRWIRVLVPRDHLRESGIERIRTSQLLSCIALVLKRIESANPGRGSNSGVASEQCALFTDREGVPCVLNGPTLRPYTAFHCSSTGPKGRPP